MSRGVPGGPQTVPSPSVQYRPAQPYLGIRGRVTMATFPAIADRMPEVFAFLGANGGAPAGPPFFRYRVVDINRELVVEAGVPTATAMAGDGDVFADEVPAGRYATVTHVGHPSELVARTAELLAWAEGQGLTWDVRDTAAGQEWGARLEVLLTDPREQPDMARWATELAFRLAD
jgi:effector-binding domain-containing protein